MFSTVYILQLAGGGGGGGDGDAVALLCPACCPLRAGLVTSMLPQPSCIVNFLFLFQMAGVYNMT